MSAWETKSDGPFTETCNCSTSLKSRNSRFEARCAALAITVRCADSLSATWLSPSPHGRGAGGGLPQGWGTSSPLGALHVAAVLRLHHDALAGLDERRHLSL